MKKGRGKDLTRKGNEKKLAIIRSNRLQCWIMDANLPEIARIVLLLESRLGFEILTQNAKTVEQPSSHP
jgi:hypothetical protein